VSELRFGVVLVNYNGWGDTKECLDSLSACSYTNKSIVVVDNASKEDFTEELRRIHPDVEWIKSTENTGWSGGNNLGIRFLLQKPNSPDVILLLNNDTIVSKDIFEVLFQAYLQDYDIVGPVINEYDKPELVQTQGTTFNRRDRSTEFFSVIRTPVNMERIVVTPVDIVNGCAVAIRKEVFEKIGLIDDRFFLICEESDFCLRALDNGFKCGVVHRVSVWHKHSVSFAKAGKPLQRYYGTRNLFLLLTKHPTGVGRKGWFFSRVAYLRMTYHTYCHEIENVNIPGSQAICQGFVDGITGVYGKQEIKPGKIVWFVSVVFDTVRNVMNLIPVRRKEKK
jgi:GT2 family glycosyltransferase